MNPNNRPITTSIFEEPSRQSLRGTDVDVWMNSCAPEGAFLQQTPRRTCAELGVCQNRKEPCEGCKSAQPSRPPQPAQPAKPRTVWVFEIVFGKIDLILLAVFVALAYTAARS